MKKKKPIAKAAKSAFEKKTLIIALPKPGSSNETPLTEKENHSSIGYASFVNSGKELLNSFTHICLVSEEIIPEGLVSFLEQTASSHTNTAIELVRKSNRLGCFKNIGWILPKGLFEELLEQNIISDKGCYKRIRTSLNSLGINYEHKEITAVEKLATQKEPAWKQLQFKANWFFIAPFKRKESQHEPQIFRGLFAYLMLALFVLLPVLSTYVGVSGDEEKHHIQAKYVYDYYMSGGEDKTALDQPKTLLHLYGQSFDNICYFLIEAFNIEKPYEFRHFLNSFTGWFTILFTGLIAALLAGWRTAFFAALLMFLSPRFLGHSLNNPVDVPFAMGCAMAFYYILKFNKSFPYPRLKDVILLAIGLGIAMSIRIGGLLFVVLTIFYAGLNYLKEYGIKGILAPELRTKLRSMIGLALLAILISYVLSMLLWPYALQDPIRNPLEALSTMTNITNALRQLFEGELIWSDAVPWYYVIKYMWISIPIVVLIGMALSIFSIVPISKKINGLNFFILLFTFIFPIAYIIYKQSNIYGGWRHLIFIYPSMIVLAALGFNQMFKLSQNKWVNWGIGLVMLALAFQPTKHIIKNFPHHYIYYNEILGGPDAAYAKYEMDYYFNTFKAASDWIKENAVEEENQNENKLTVAGNGPFGHHFSDTKEQVKSVYCRYYSRGDKDWDYFIAVNAYVKPSQLKRKTWPPKNAVKVYYVDNSPICAILKREDRSDLLGYQLMSAGKQKEAIPYFNRALRQDPDYELAYLNLVKCYLDIGDYPKAISAGAAALKKVTNWDKALYYTGLAYLYNGQNDYAISSLNRLLKVNYKFTQAYYYLGVAYAQTEQFGQAEKYLDLAIQNQPSNRAAYQAMGRVLELQGKKDDAQRYYQAANSIK